MRSRMASALLLALTLAGCGSASSSSSSATSSAGASGTASAAAGTSGAPSPSLATLGPEGILLERGTPLGPASTTNPSGSVDGVQCAPVEQLAYHVHAHIQVYVDGQPRVLPEGIGIPQAVAQQTPQGSFVGSGRCFYWLHTHTTDGVIHIESPTARIYSLGTFFDIWGQPLSSNRVAGAAGAVTAFLNGKPWTKNPRAIPLESHFLVQLDVGKPVVPFTKVSFGNSGL
jgi:hypothetical protein